MDHCSITSCQQINQDNNMDSRKLSDIRKEQKAAEDILDAFQKEAKKFSKKDLPEELKNKIDEAKEQIDHIKKQLCSKAFVFGALKPTGNIEALNEQYYLGFLYKKELLKFEVEQRQRYAEIETKYGGEELAKLRENKKQIDEKIKEVKDRIAKYKEEHSSKTASPELRAEMKPLKQEKKEALGKISAFKKTMDSEAYNEAKSEHRQWINEEYKRIRTEFGQSGKGLGWGTQAVIAEAVEDTRKGRKAPSTFVDRTREVVAAQIQTDRVTRMSMTLDEAFSCTDNRFRIKRLPDSAFEKGSSRKSRHTVAQIKIGSQKNPKTGRRTRVPIMVEVPICMHRKLPPDSMIKWVKLFREKDANKWLWRLSLSVEFTKTIEDADISSILGVDLGWRQVEGGWRIAYWALRKSDIIVESGELIVPDRIINKLTHADKVKSVIDENRDNLKEWISEWYKKQDKRKIPDIVRDELKNVHTWLSHNKFIVFIRVVSGNAFPNSDQLLDVLVKWKHRYKHLLAIWKGDKRRAISARNTIYRQFAHMLRTKANILGLEDMSLVEFKESPQPDSAKEESKTAKRQLQYSAPGTLRKYLEEKFDYIVRVNRAYTSQLCPDCRDMLDYGDNRAFGYCKSCQKMWDRDLVGSSNISLKALEKIESVGIVEACKKPKKEDKRESE